MADNFAKLGGFPESGKTGYDVSPRVREDAISYLPPMVAHAQNFEDVILRRALQDIEQGFYIDIGAWHPVLDSVTAWFYECGWRGINVEPNPEYFVELERTRTRDINLSCVVGATNGTNLFTVLEGTGLSSGVPGAVEALGYEGSAQQRVVALPQVTLEHIFALAKNTVVDFLKVDAEGMESDILNPAAFELVRPRIIVVEATRPNTQVPCHHDWEPQLLAKGYNFVLFDGLNRFYLRHEDAWRKPIFTLPPCVFDNFYTPTLAAHRRELESALSRSEAASNAAVERAVSTEAALKQSASQVETLEAALSRSEAASNAAVERAVSTEAALKQSASQVEMLEAALARADERRRDAVRAEAKGREELDAANLRIGSLEDELGQARRDAAAWDEARTIKLDPGSVPWLFRWPAFSAAYRHLLLRNARRAMRRQSWADAARDFRAALACKSDRPYVWVEYGHALKESGAFAEAAVAYRKVLLSVPNHPDIAQHLSFVTGLVREQGARGAKRQVKKSGSSIGSRLSRPDPVLAMEGGALQEANANRQLNLIARDIGLALPVRLN